MGKATTSITSPSFLPENLREKFEVKEGVKSKFADQHGVVDLTEITEAQAEQLVERGYLIKKSSGG